MIFGSSCTVIFRTSFLNGVHKAAPAVASRAQLDNFWDQYWWVFVKGYHALEYCLLFWLIAFAVRKPARWPVVGAIWLACVGYAATDEYHQTFVPDRGGRWTDVVIDAGGAAFAATVWKVRSKRFESPLPSASFSNS